MATSAIARVSGRVLRSADRSGTKDGRDYVMYIVTVLVGGVGTTELALFDRDIKTLRGSVPQPGDDVDLTVEIVRSERGFNINILGVWSDSDVLAALSS